ncbi:cellulose synthase regulator BcsB [Erwinia sp. OLTSP20]|uniref:cellulose biosynthesis cyclic di-GMP-binding regulatory protein BcsB n=1 Tax=unclassified Erwinia TaxID=2622719 RepID=UPI000C177782|nr:MULTISPECIES: cellulose biosynthesis cyclic di-GMP-binding regulatory protein BcsB [unclassified Erwinia]PIJ50745.1 cellulose synthase regulator BcsB [Erwinia sp. OAMSP11]PIJ75414.1 cellulose synthase regulator BcsB [Erwinia sp. OLSSP12]PIJ81912.1 cellulose synthase regulator BcsB [Erwinia sp. OLCASP19]PIJ84567.1 cellulose synthase regulator BcsB [Erwinia sp. OLMTSP26]PIJ86914.1 cellulose synthase regulator BcsB [Erwinia sp. OLMDSP33]
MSKRLLLLGALLLTAVARGETNSLPPVNPAAAPAGPAQDSPASVPGGAAVLSPSPGPAASGPGETAPGQAETLPPSAGGDLPPLPPVVSPDTAPAQAGGDVFNLPFSGSMTVAQMGQPQGITLGSGQLQAGMMFTLPTDQVVTHASLALSLKISPALAARNGSLQLMLNGQPLGTLPLNASDTDTVDYQLDIPAAMVVAENNLSFKVNDSGGLQCERDTNRQYQLTILPGSRLSLEGQQLDIVNSLQNFPRPFIDPLRMTTAEVPVVFSATPTPGEVSAAAILASWLGMQTDYRGIRFPVSHDRLPEGNAVIFGHPGENIAGVPLPPSTQPLIKLVNNPANPVGKLLLVVGNDDEQLRQAAWRLVNGPMKVEGDSLTVTPQTVAVHRPYDAQRWINTQRPVKLSELLRDNQSLVSSGMSHGALQLSFRAAPDLFLWDGETFPLNIHYRFPSESWLDDENSSLSVSLNGTFLRDLTVNKQGILETLWRQLGGDARQERYILQLDPYLIYGDNQLQFYFNIQPKASAPCNVLDNDNIRSQIAPDSSIDLSDTRHFTLLPNLSYFVGASFPFSRLADYANTLLMLPEKPTDAQIATLLTLAARSGSATGVALTRNRVLFGVPPGGMLHEQLRQNDLLAVTTLDGNDFNRQMFSGSPFSLNNNDRALGVPPPSTLEKAQAWLTGDWDRHQLDADRYLSSNEQWRGFVSYRSPWSPGNLVVMALATDDTELLKLNHDLRQPKLNAGVRGDSAIITDENGVRSFRVGAQFPSGQMPWYMMVVWYASQHSVMLALVALLLAIIAGSGTFMMLRRHARKRLQDAHHHDEGNKND